MNWINETITEVRNNSKKRSKQIQFGVLLLVLILALLGYSIYKAGLVFDLKQVGLAVIAIIIASITLAYPKIFYPLLIIWLLLGNILGVISSFIIYTLIYFLIITPVSVLLRIIKKDTGKVPGWINKTNVIDYRKLF